MKIFVIRAGVVGFSIGRNLIENGHQVVFVDINEGLVEKLSADGFDAVSLRGIGAYNTDVSIITVLTPITEDGIIHINILLKSLRFWVRIYWIPIMNI